ncbi:hypothetical protein ABW20_dc0106383 [Dactylellina cionopaga]|nr:hypothetical protein ABW20_dc0106383 [Dactylellina cionopaga]
MEAAIRSFFSSAKFAVVGASADEKKYGYKGEDDSGNSDIYPLTPAVLSWYLSHDLPVIGINPKTPVILGQQSVPDLTSLEDPSETSVSIITPPAVTLKTLQQAKEQGIKLVWCQPGSESDEVLAFAKDNGITCIANGACVLVDGERGLKSAGRELKL